MPLQNRVLPTGEIVAAPWRGALMGNRGCLHDAELTLGRARWRHRNWVCCVTAFRGRWRAPMPLKGAPTIYTALFFWDEASAFAAGHRPCAQCRWTDYRRFVDAWQMAGVPGRKAADMDRHLHPARVHRDRRQVRHRASSNGLPPGTFVLIEHNPVVITDDAPLIWSPDGYRRLTVALPTHVEVLTPEPIVALFRAGYRPKIAM